MAPKDVKMDIDAMLLQTQPYFVGKPEAFQQSADVLLVLDCKQELPVHSAFLSAHLSVLSDILTATKPEDGAVAPRRVPFPDCTEKAVNALLLCLYAQNPTEFLSIRSAQDVTHLAHKFGMQGMLRLCDDFFASKGGSGGSLDALRVRSLLQCLLLVPASSDL